MPKKYQFLLRGVSTDVIDKRFGLTTTSISDQNDTMPKNTTKISELSTSKNKDELISFIDESKKSHKCTVSMIDFDSGKERDTRCQGSQTYYCFWDKSPIPQSITPIGCPIKYMSSQIIKNYYSEISKDYYTIKENVTEKRLREIISDKKHPFTVVNRNYYITDGVFCSFNCCMAYILSNKHDSMYSLSSMLLLKMYFDMFKVRCDTIEPAPMWRKLKMFGGDLSLTEFRQSFNKVEYVCHGHVTCKSIGTLYEEKLKF